MQNNLTESSSKLGSTSQTCFTGGEKERTFYAYPQRWVNLTQYEGEKEKLLEQIYDEYDEQEVIDSFLLKEESLMVVH